MLKMLTFNNVELTEDIDPIINDDSINIIDETIMSLDDTNDPYVTTLQPLPLECNDGDIRVFLVGHIYLPVGMYYNGMEEPMYYHWIDTNNAEAGECLALYIIINPENNKYYRFAFIEENNIIDITKFREEEGKD